MNDAFDKWNKWLKLLALFPIWGWITSCLYRIFAFVKSKDAPTLVLGILCFVISAPVGFVVAIIDFVTVAMTDKITVVCKG